jgi:predicted amidohydrolase
MRLKHIFVKAAKENADIIVLPEMWNISFYPDNVRQLADTEGVRTKAFLSRLAKKLQVNIVGGSVADYREGNVYNTTYIVNREGELVASYDKAHLFTPGKEDTVFTPGDRINAFMLDDIPMASIICYDLRFCEWVRMAALTGAQMIFVPAAWPNPRCSHWQILNRARAIENQCFVTAVNSCGDAGHLHFSGHSMIIDPWGEVLAQGQDTAQIITADVDFSDVAKIRNKINAFKDRRPCIYDL